MEAWWDNIDADGRRRNYRERLNWSQLRDRRCASASRGPSFLHRWWGISSPKWPFRWRSPPSDACLNLSNSMALNYLSRFSYWYICRPLFILSYFILLFFLGGEGEIRILFHVHTKCICGVCVCVCVFRVSNSWLLPVLSEWNQRNKWQCRCVSIVSYGPVFSFAGKKSGGK